MIKLYVCLQSTSSPKTSLTSICASSDVQDKVAKMALDTIQSTSGDRSIEPMKDGLPHEQVECIYPDGSRYIGAVREGSPHGYGKCFYPDGSSYIGGWVNGQRCGKGAFTDAEGVREGRWKEDRLFSLTKVISADGTIAYEGQFVNGKLHGRGKAISRRGDVYEGMFKHGVSDGQGKIEYGDGSHYEGQFQDGMPHGEGTMKFPNGNSFKGQFLQGFPDGHGTMELNHGDLFEGMFKRGVFHGYGKLTTVDGFYEGLFENGERHGYGTFTYWDDSYESGTWVKGKKQGEFICVPNRGSSFIHKWEDDVRTNTLEVPTELGNKPIIIGPSFSDNSLLIYTGQPRYEDRIYRGAFKTRLSSREEIGIRQGVFRNGELVRGIYPSVGKISLGEFEKGQLQGRGRIIFNDGSNENGLFHEGVLTKGEKKENGITYIGSFESNQDCRRMIIEWPDGRIYEGEVQNGLPNGRGEMIQPGIGRLVGVFSAGQLNGLGTIFYEDGAIYQGQVQASIPNGKGKLTAGGNIILGEFRDKKPYGVMVCSLVGDRKYVGELNEDDKPHGRGKVTYSDGSSYEGEFVNGSFQGRGVLLYSNGNRYEGQFEQNRFHGHGKYTYGDDVYEGEWKNHQKDGMAIHIYNGSRFEGEYRTNKKHGKGVTIYPDGSQRTEIYANGKRQNVTS